MSVQRVLIFLALLSAAFAVGAADFSAYGLAEAGSVDEDGLSYTVLVDSKGDRLLLASTVEPSPERLSALTTLADSVNSWEGLSVAEIRASNDASRLRVAVLPRSITVDGAELLAALPGGLAFYYDKVFEYDFRVKSGIYAVRLTGIFSTPEELFASIALAWKDPVAWTVQRDPQYAIRRITELSLRTTKLEEGMETDVADLASTRDDLASARDDLVSTQEGLASAMEEIASLKDELAASREEAAAAAAAGAEALAAAVASFEEEKSASAAASANSSARLEEALMTALNVGFLSGPKPIKADSVAWVLAKKAEDPALGKAALVAAAKAEKVAVTDKEIGIVLLVKFGER